VGASNIQAPPLEVPFLDKNGQMARQWARFFISLQTGVAVDAAPANGPYVITQADSDLSNPANLGALSTGYLRIVVTLGVAVVSALATISATELTPGSVASAIDGQNITGLNASALATGTVPDGRFPANLPAIGGAALTSLNAAVLAGILPALNAAALTALTGANLNHTVLTKTHADTGYVANNDETVLGDASGGALTIKLPASLVSGKLVTVKKIDSSGTAVIVNGNGANIDGAATQSLAAQWNAFVMQNDGTAWYIVGKV
jgi:hypothetical protein